MQQLRLSATDYCIDVVAVVVYSAITAWLIAAGAADQQYDSVAFPRHGICRHLAERCKQTIFGHAAAA